jgi:hypothetical protein
MNNTLFHYHAFGLNICSELEIPPLFSTKNIAKADVTVRRGDVAESGLENPKKSTPFFQCAKESVWLNVPQIARFLITDGSTITVDAIAEDEQSIRLFLLGSCLGAIMHQRGLLVLHGNAIRFGDHCVVFAGASGMGKSTLAAAFHKRGHEILTDDVCAINADGRVSPGYPQLKLWSDTLARLEIEKADLNKIRLQVEKFAYPIKKSFGQEPLPVKAVYILNSNNRDEFEFEEIKGMKKFQPLKNQTYRKGYLDGMELNAGHLQLCGNIAGKVHLARISRPNHGFKLKLLVEHIQADLEKHGLAE